MPSTAFYAVQTADSQQIFTSWTEAKPHCVGVKGVKYKKFHSEIEAKQWLGIDTTTDTDIVDDTDVVQLPDVVDVYTDGACTDNGYSEARAGMGVFFAPNHPLNVSEPLPREDRQTNNRAELLAIERAIDILLDQPAMPSEYHIHTDSMYCINALTKWVHGWVTKNWMTSKGTEAENRDIIERLYYKMEAIYADEQCDLQLHHIRGHKGLYGNTQADELAVASLERW